MMHLETITKSWEALHRANLRPIQTEAEYEAMLELMHELTRRYDVTTEPHRSLWRLGAHYMTEWERVHDELSTETIHGYELLRALMNSRQLTQQHLAELLEINQGHLSRLLRGQRGINRKLAAKLEATFGVPAASFTVI